MSSTDRPQAERLQKVLATAGMGSRREIEQWIREGRIRINDRLAQLGDRITEKDVVKVDGRPLSWKRLGQRTREIIIYNKPEGELVARHDPQGRATVFERLPRPKHGRWITVGRLDVNTSGLLILTTDGELAHRLMHPSQQVEREYAVRVFGEIREEHLEQLVNGLELEDGPARFEEITASGGEGINRWFHVVIMEGRKREVRRLWEAVGLTVSRLKRVRYGPIVLDSKVKAGHWRELTPDERQALLTMVGMQDEIPAVKTPAARTPARRAKQSARPRHRR